MTISDEARAPRPSRQPSRDDELKFTGLRDTDIPSKSFHKLQSYTGSSEQLDHHSPARTPSHHEDEEEVSPYNEQSIRYRGDNIPSRSFKMLQSMTGEDEELPPDRSASRSPTRRPRHRPPVQKPEPPETHSDEVVDLSYVGANIPSKSFKILQQSIGDQPGAENDSGIVSSSSSPVESHAPKVIPPEARRRRRRPERGPPPQQEEQQPAAFDEAAFLSGRVAILSDPEELKRRQPRVIRSTSRPSREDSPPPAIKDYDEQKFLAGKIALFGGETEGFQKPQDEPEEEPEWAQKFAKIKQREQELDDLGNLAGKVGKGVGAKQDYEWKRRLEQQETDFDESQFLGKADSTDAGESTPEWASAAERKKSHFDETAILAQRRPSIEPTPEWAPKVEGRQGKEFDENKILAARRPSIETTPEWAARAENKKPLDETAILAARRPSVEMTPEWANKAKKQPFDESNILAWASSKQKKDESAPEWAEQAEEKKKTFDENIILQRRASQDHGLKPEWQAPAPKGEDFDEAKFIYGEAAAAAAAAAADPTPVTPTSATPQDFDEEAFLQGKVSLFGGETKPRPVKEPPKPEGPVWTLQKKKRTALRGGPSGDIEFDESAYLGQTDVKQQRRRRPPPQQQPEEEPPKSDESFDEQAFLSGRLSILGGSVDNKLPPRESGPKQTQLAPWQKFSNAGEEIPDAEEKFSEDAFLRGKVPVLRNSVDRDNVPPRIPEPADKPLDPRRFRERAPWERPVANEPEEGDSSSQGGDFDERQFLHGMTSSEALRASQERDVPVLSGGARKSRRDQPFTRIPSKTFIRLSRSVSRDNSREATPETDKAALLRRSHSEERPEVGELGGPRIPSRTFIRLRRNVDNTTPDPLDKLRQRKKEKEQEEKKKQEGIDVDEAIEKLQIEETKPENYLDKLKQSVENSHIKIELENDVTDF